jgi:hypothetical protein
MSLKSFVSVQNRLTWSLVGAAVVAVAAIGLYLLLHQPSVDIRKLKLSNTYRCTTEPVTFRATDGAPARTVFRLDMTWHFVRPCVAQLLAAARKQPPTAPIHDFIYHQILYVLSRKPVQFHQSGEDKQYRLSDVIDDKEQFDFGKFDRVAYTNNQGVPHNAMSQGEFGDLLLAASRESVDFAGTRPDYPQTYLNLALASFGVMLDGVDAGGLRARSACANKPEYQCSFFHAVTNTTRESPQAGGTLNKHLIAIRELFNASETLRAMETAGQGDNLGADADRFAEAAIEGINQLSYAAGNRSSGEPPNLIDFIPKTDDGKPVQESWLYYSINPIKQNGYFLKPDPYRNCSYHILDLNLLYGILKKIGSQADIRGLTETNSYLGKSILKFVVDSYRIKLENGGLYVDSPSKGAGEFNACREGYRDPMKTPRLDFLTGLDADAGGDTPDVSEP